MGGEVRYFMDTGTLSLPRNVGRWTLHAASASAASFMVLDMIPRAHGDGGCWVPRMFTEAWNIGVGRLSIVVSLRLRRRRVRAPGALSVQRSYSPTTWPA